MNTLDRTSEELINILIEGYKRDDYIISDTDVKLPSYIENNIRDEFEKLRDAGLISKFEIWITGNWEVGVRPTLFTYFDEKEKNREESLAYTTNIYGNVSNLQLQQGTINSTQNQTIEQGFDYSVVENIIEQIKKYENMIDLEFGDKASELRNKVEELDNLVREKKNPRKINAVLSDIKSLAIGVTGSLIASGIVAMIGR